MDIVDRLRTSNSAGRLCDDAARHYEDIESEVRKLAMSLPPSDFGAHLAIQAVARYVHDKLQKAREDEQAAAFKRYEF